LHKFIVVPANAGTHTPRLEWLEKEDNDQRAKQGALVVMGPCVRRDDSVATLTSINRNTRLARDLDPALGLAPHHVAERLWLTMQRPA
jgi:hypothetical protein